MRILLLCDEYPPCKHGGIGTFTQSLARELVKKENLVYVSGLYPYFRKAKHHEVDRGVIVTRIFYGNWLTLRLSRHKWFGRFINLKPTFKRYLKYLRSYIVENKIDVIEIPDFNEIFRYTGIKHIEFGEFNIPKIIRLHGTYTLLNTLKMDESLSTALYRKESTHIRNSNGIIAVSKFTRDEAINAFKISRPIKVIYNGLELSQSVRYEKNDSKEVVYAGTLTETKGIFSLIRAWDHVVRIIPDATLTIYGKASSNVLEKVGQLADKVVLDTIKYAGFVEKTELQIKYSTSACSVFPSYYENFSLSPLEAMSIGCPTIFTKRASGPELIENMVDGILIEPDNHLELSEAICYLIENREQAYLMGLKGKSKISRYFDISGIADENLNYYRECILENNIQDEKRR